MKSLVFIGALAAFVVTAVPDQAEARGGSRCTRSINANKPHCVAQRLWGAELYRREVEDAKRLGCPFSNIFKAMPDDWTTARVRVPRDVLCHEVIIPAGWVCEFYETRYGGRPVLVINIEKHQDTTWDRTRRFFGIAHPADADRVGCPTRYAPD